MGQVSSFHFRSIEGRRFQKVENRPVQVRIDNNLMVTLVTPAGTEACHIEFNYTASYGPLGVIKIDGEFTYSGPLAGQCLKEWDAKRQMPPEAAGEIHTGIMHACVPEAVGLARMIHLPPPIPLPVVRFEKGGEKPAAPSASPEVS